MIADGTPLILVALWWIYSIHLPISIVRAWRRSCARAAAGQPPIGSYRSRASNGDDAARALPHVLVFGLNCVPDAVVPLVVIGALSASWVPETYGNSAWRQGASVAYVLLWIAFVLTGIVAVLMSRAVRRFGCADARWNRLKRTGVLIVVAGLALLFALFATVGTLSYVRMDALFGAPLGLAMSIALILLGRALARLGATTGTEAS